MSGNFHSAVSLHFTYYIRPFTTIWWCQLCLL